MEAADTSRRWNVTYTKHIKQKRKVYHDGFLHASANKVTLFDESKNKLGCRLLKNSEVVNSGETLTFDAHLVDIGDPICNQKDMSDSNMCNTGAKISKQSQAMYRPKFRSPTVSSDRVGTCTEKNTTMLHATGPSRKIIREFKLRETQKYTASNGSDDLAENSTTGSIENDADVREPSIFGIINACGVNSNKPISESNPDGSLQDDTTAGEIAIDSTPGVSNAQSGVSHDQSRPLRNACQILSCIRKPDKDITATGPAMVADCQSPVIPLQIHHHTKDADVPKSSDSTVPDFGRSQHLSGREPGKYEDHFVNVDPGINCSEGLASASNVESNPTNHGQEVHNKAFGSDNHPSFDLGF